MFSLLLGSLLLQSPFCVAGVSAVSFIPVVACVPALVGFPAVEDVFAVASFPACPTRTRTPGYHLSASGPAVQEHEEQNQIFLSLLVGHSVVNQLVVFLLSLLH
jgi:hypothetical protein